MADLIVKWVDGEVRAWVPSGRDVNDKPVHLGDILRPVRSGMYEASDCWEVRQLKARHGGVIVESPGLPCEAVGLEEVREALADSREALCKLPEILCEDGGLNDDPEPLLGLGRLLSRISKALRSIEHDSLQMLGLWHRLDPENPPRCVVLAYGVNSSGKPRRLRAKYVGPRELEIHEDVFDFGDYDEDTGESWCPPGWYEWVDGDAPMPTIDFELTHWMHLPPGPVDLKTETK